MSTEKIEVLSPKRHKEIEKELHKTGHTAVNQLNQEERDKVLNTYPAPGKK